ncbi:MAG TPA: zf-HC2 domain-containing protein [Acidimicrobiales bacterium]|nr:zf-HC2 domain-containing protein [Acidimicrobiales bacterium]
MISCQEAVRKLWEYLENDVDAAQRADLDGHLALCRRCCGEAEFTDELRQMLRSSSGPHLPPGVEGHLVAFLDSFEGEPQ